MNKIGNIKKYIVDVLGLSFSLGAECPVLNPPLNRFFEIFQVKIGDIVCCLLYPNGDITKPAILIKRANAVAQAININCAIVLDSMGKSLRRALIKSATSFVVPNKQLFMPFLGAYLSEIRLNENPKRGKLTPAAQLLLLRHILFGDIEGKPLNIVAKKLDYPSKTISIISTELRSNGLCVIENIEPRSKAIKFLYSLKDLWKLSLPLLSSPISKKGYILKERINDLSHYILSGDDALSIHTQMGITGSHSIALDKGSAYVKSLKAELELIETDGTVGIELWKYDPLKLSQDGYIDPLSLYLCYKENDDERIQGQLEKLINRIL